MTNKEIPVLKKDGEIAITSAYSSDEITYAVKKGNKLILKKAKIEEE